MLFNLNGEMGGGGGGGAISFEWGNAGGLSNLNGEMGGEGYLI